MSKLTKKQKALQGKVDSNKLYPLTDALSIVKECANAKFDESIDVAVQLGVDAELHGDVNGFVELGGGVFLHQVQRVGQRVQLGRFNLAVLGFLLFRQLGHLHTLHRDAHRAGGAGDRAHGSVQIGGGHVLHLGLGDLFQLSAGDLADLVSIGLG